MESGRAEYLARPSHVQDNLSTARSSDLQKDVEKKCENHRESSDGPEAWKARLSHESRIYLAAPRWPLVPLPLGGSAAVPAYPDRRGAGTALAPIQLPCRIGQLHARHVLPNNSSSRYTTAPLPLSIK